MSITDIELVNPMKTNKAIPGNKKFRKRISANGNFWKLGSIPVIPKVTPEGSKIIMAAPNQAPIPMNKPQNN
jgi:hypothetical protein